jgi:hypothetical protein
VEGGVLVTFHGNVDRGILLRMQRG